MHGASTVEFRRWWGRWAVCFAVLGVVGLPLSVDFFHPSDVGLRPLVVALLAAFVLVPSAVLVVMVRRGPERSTVASRRSFRWGALAALSGLVPTPFALWSILVPFVAVPYFVVALTDPSPGRRGEVGAATLLTLAFGAMLVGVGDEEVWKAVGTASCFVASLGCLAVALRARRRRVDAAHG